MTPVCVGQEANLFTLTLVVIIVKSIYPQLPSLKYLKL